MTIIERQRRKSDPSRLTDERSLSLFSFPIGEIFKVREAAYRGLGFEGAMDLKRVKSGKEFSEKDPREVLRAVVMVQTVPYDDAAKYRKDAALWERMSQDRARIVFTAVMSFVNTSLRIGSYDIELFYRAIEQMSLGDEILQPLRGIKEGESEPESEKELKEKLEKARKLTEEDPTQIVLWENRGLDVLPNEVVDYLIGIISTIHYSAIPDYEERLRKRGLVSSTKRDWRKSIDPNVKDLKFLISKETAERRGIIEVRTDDSVPYLTSDPKEAFLAKVFEPSIYDSKFSYTRAMAYWDKEFEGRVRQKGMKLDEAKTFYESRWAWTFYTKRIKESVFDLEMAKAFLELDNVGPSALLEQAAIALYGKSDSQFDPQREIIGLRLLERGYLLFRDPVFARASRIENERARDLQKLRRDKAKEDKVKHQEKTFKHDEGKREFVVQYYTKKVEHWMGQFLDIAGPSSPLYREYGDLHDKNLKEWGVYEKLYARKREKATRSTMNKMTVADYRTKLENAGFLSLGELYRLAINALRNPRKGKEPTSELVGFELLAKCYEMASADLRRQLNKAFFARVLIEEYTRKWVKNRLKGQTEPKIRSIIFTMMQSIWAMKQRGENPLPTPSIKPLQESFDPDKIPE